MAADLLLFYTQEFRFIALPDSMTTGSSIMPQKRNPDVLELVRGAVPTMQAALVEILGLPAKLGSGYQRDLQRMKSPLFRAIDLAGDRPQVMAHLIRGLKFLPENIRAGRLDPRRRASERARAEGRHQLPRGVPARGRGLARARAGLRNEPYNPAMRQLLPLPDLPPLRLRHEGRSATSRRQPSLRVRGLRRARDKGDRKTIPPTPIRPGPDERRRQARAGPPPRSRRRLVLSVPRVPRAAAADDVHGPADRRDLRRRQHASADPAHAEAGHDGRRHRRAGEDLPRRHLRRVQGASRETMPDDLRAQVQPLLDDRGDGHSAAPRSGVEADDVIGTLAQQAAAAGLNTLISTGDKDLAQLVDEHVRSSTGSATGSSTRPASSRSSA